MAPKLERVVRLDSIRLDSTHFTKEGFLIDNPIVTSCGIFEYTNPDGSKRRELRLPEHVFDDESLASYEGKPIIITHEAGTVDKSNVDEEYIGTILSPGNRDGDDVRAKIIIHDTESMKRSGLKELSLGYSLVLDNTPGEWNGEPYDAIQTKIRVNHLALVEQARAGEKARLNIDSKDNCIKGGTRKMALPKKNSKKKAHKRSNTKASRRYDSDEKQDSEENKDSEGSSVEELVEKVRANHDRRDQEDPVQCDEDVQEVLDELEEDVDVLLAVVDQLMTQGDSTENDDSDNEDEENEDEDDHGDNDNEDEENEDSENEDEDNEDGETLNKDSVDRIVRARVALARIGDQLRLDGLDEMPIMDAKRKIIRKVNPDLRLDGKSKAYINAAFDMAVDQVKKGSSTDRQRQQMRGGGKNARHDGKNGGSQAEAARKKMIEKRYGKGERK